MRTLWTSRIFVAGLLALGLNAGAEAVLINLDVNDTQDPDHGHVPPYPVENYSGAAVVGTAGDQWNYLNPPAQSSPTLTVSSLIDSAGAATGASFTLNSSGYNNHRTGTNALLNDYILTFVPGTFTIAGLQPLGTYDLYLYSTAGSVGLGGRYVVGGNTQTATGTVSYTGFVLNENYVRYLGINADGSGNITGSFVVNPGSGIGSFNGFQLQSVPEPASILALACGALTLVRRRR